MKITMYFIHGISLLLLMWSGCVVYGSHLSLLGDFDVQVKHLLQNEMLSPEEIDEIKLGYDDLQETLRTRWKCADLYPYGSLPAGLGTKTSDMDLYLQIPSYNGQADVYFVKETAKILHKHPEKYADIILKLEKKIPMLIFYNLLLQRYIDLSFNNSSGVENTKLVAYILGLDKRYIPLAAIIKYWCKVNHLTGKGLLPNYSVYLMIVFYLQQKNMAPSGYDVQAHLPPRYVNRWNTNFEEIPYRVDNKETLYELLGGFFKYYNEFNFAEHCASPYAGRPVARRDFKDLCNVPKEFSTYTENFNAGNYHLLSNKGEICVQDVFEHNRNSAKRLDSAGVSAFMDNLKRSAEYFDKLPRDKFLGAILTKNKHKKNKRNITS